MRPSKTTRRVSPVRRVATRTRVAPGGARTFTLVLAGRPRAWLESLGDDPVESLRILVKGTMWRQILRCARADEAWLRESLHRYEDIAEEDAMLAAELRPQDQRGDTTQAACARAAAHIRRLVTASPNPIVRAAYKRLLLAEKCRNAAPDDAAADRLWVRLQRLRLERPGLWRRGPRGPLHPELPRVRFKPYRQVYGPPDAKDDQRPADPADVRASGAICA